MKIAFITPNPFGLQGTPGTYNLIDSFSKRCDVKVFAGCFSNTVASLVYNSKNNYDIHEINYKDNNDIEWMVDKITKFHPDIVYYCSGQIWKINNAYITKKIRENLSDVKVVLDIKSPPLIDNDEKAKLFREESSSYQYLLDLVLSRSKEDIEEWFLDIRIPYAIYPLGISLSSFVPRVFRAEKKICRRFVYIGALHKRREIDKFLYYVSNLSNDVKSRIAIDIFGSGPFYSEAQKIIKNNVLENIVNLNGAMNQEKLFRAMPNYDVGIGWVPYKKYDFAPSLKSLEYIAAGLVPFVSDTFAHERLMHQGFNVKFFSLNKYCFAEAVERLVYKGVSTSMLTKNLEVIKKYDWDHVIDEYIYPHLKHLATSCYSSVYVNTDFTICQNENFQKNFSFVNNKILFVVDSSAILNSTLKNILNAFLLSDDSVNVCCPSVDDEKLNFMKKTNYCWSDFENFVLNLKRSLYEFKPDILVWFYSGQINIQVLSILANFNGNIILSERMHPTRILCNCTEDYVENKCSDAIWLRELIRFRANMIHIQHNNYISYFATSFFSKIVAFSDDITTCSLKMGREAFVKIMSEWIYILSQAIKVNKFDDHFQSVCGEDEHCLHAWRMLERFKKK